MKFPTVPAPQMLIDEIYQPLELLCMEAIELSPKGKELDATRDELLASIEEKITPRLAGKLSDLCNAYVCEYGDEMFKLGLAIGRNPALIFELGESEGQ